MAAFGEFLQEGPQQATKNNTRAGFTKLLSDNDLLFNPKTPIPGRRALVSDFPSRRRTIMLKQMLRQEKVHEHDLRRFLRVESHRTTELLITAQTICYHVR